MIPRLASIVSGVTENSFLSRAGDPPALDLPCTYICNPRTELTTLVGTAPNFLWVADDDNTPTIGPTLTATGTPGSLESPYQLEDGTALNFETYTGSEYRRATTDTTLDPAAGQDLVVCSLVRMPRVATSHYIIVGTYAGFGRGWILYQAQTTGYPVFYISADAGATAQVTTACLGQIALLIGLCNRDGNMTCFLNGTAGTPVASPAGSYVGGGTGLAAEPGGAYPFAGGIIFTACWKGNGLNEIWTANSNELIKKVTAAFTGTLPRAGGLPTFARNSSASWKDRNGRYWLASAGLPRAGDRQTNSESGIRLAAARTNSCYRNVNPADGSTWLLDSAGCAYGSSVIVDGDMETAGVAAWSAGNSATLTKDTTSPHAGTNCLRVAYNGTINPNAYQTVTTVGKSYRFQGWARGDGTAVPRVYCGSSSVWVGTNSTDWQYFDVRHVATGTTASYLAAINAAGYCEFDDISVRPSMNLLSDGDMENAATTAWAAINGATLSKSATTPHGGTYCLRVTFNGTANPAASQAVVTGGKTYRVTGWARGDGSVYPSVYDAGSVALWTGTSSTDWQSFDVTYVATGTGAHHVMLFCMTAGAGYAEFDDLWLEEAVQVYDDSAALTTAKVECFGPNVFEFDNTTGTVDRYMYQGAAAGSTNRFSISVIGDLVTGSGAQIGLWDTADSSFSNGNNITDSYVRTIADNITPTATEHFCVKVPAGCKVRWIAQQMESNGQATFTCVSTSPIPNWATAATAARSQETFTMPLTPSDVSGGIEVAITPIGWNNWVWGNVCVCRAGGPDYIVSTSDASGKWYCSDGTTGVTVPGISPTDGIRHVVKSSWSAMGQKLTVNGTVATAAYDGSRAWSGAYIMPMGTIAGAESSFDSIRIFNAGK